ncbi:DIE2/ALG10 family-domain-containing protein [Entophlyctis helioformis]|nr:DIE2/ALG10 family-domain-containing protein [Entophlyctis helioformis]
MARRKQAAPQAAPQAVEPQAQALDKQPLDQQPLDQQPLEQPPLEQPHSGLLLAALALAAAVLYAALLLGLAWRVDSLVPGPYMDEIFHIPQAQAYCRAMFRSWDPKITTPAGPYLVSAAARWLLASLASHLAIPVPENSSLAPGGGCSVFMLRSLNTLFGLATPLLILALLRHIHCPPSHVQSRAPTAPRSAHLSTSQSTSQSALLALEAVAVSLFPVSFFFHSLYYTDSGSTFFILLAYYLSLRDKIVLSTLACFVSIWFRQTNAVWLIFMAGTTAVRIFHQTYPDSTLDCPPAQLQSPSHLARILAQFAWRCVADLPYLIWRLWPYMFLLEACIIFVVFNEGITMGDKENHVPGLHVPQLYYFFGFTAFFGLFPLGILSSLTLAPRTLWSSLGRSDSLAAVAAAPVVMAETIRRFTIEHPFLLSDNRHFTFYIWKNVYRRHALARYVLIPGYMVSIWAVMRRFATTQSVLWHVVFGVCLAAALVPSPLLEFRYFMVPYLILRVHAPRPSGPANGQMGRVVGELLMNAAVNAAVFWLFLMRPFVWGSRSMHDASGSVPLQRFMW